LAAGSSATFAAPADDTNPSSWTLTPVTDANVQKAVAALPGIVADVRARTGVPGLALAVVYKGKVLTSAGYGERLAGSGLPVDANTVFQMASVSKPVGATVVSHAVSQGLVSWDDTIRTELPGFALGNDYVSANVTIADMYAHRSGLPDHAGDDLEDVGFDRATILNRLRYLPLRPFRATYEYTNFGLTAGAEAVAHAAGMSWANLAEKSLFAPAGMTSSSYLFSDYLNAPDRAVTHVLKDGTWQPGEVRNAQPEAPAGGLSSTANDMARWLLLQLGNGTLNGRNLIDPAVLQLMRQPHSVSVPASDPAGRSTMYGYGILTGVNGTGDVVWSHSGAFLLGAGTVVQMLPGAELGIVVMGNASPLGQVEAVAASFMDIATTGEIQRDWVTGYGRVFSPMYVDHSVLAGRTPPVGAKPALPLNDYVGSYANDYVGLARVIRKGAGLALVLGPTGNTTTFPLTAWGGNRFSYSPTGENAVGLSAVDFAKRASTVTIEQLDEYGLGTLARARA
jgi:CubicO group peptidase (beta-lactamase class C family)